MFRHTSCFQDSLVRAVDIINGQNSKVAVVTEIAQCDTRSSLQAKVFNGFARGIESNGHGEKVAIGEARFGDNTKSVRKLFLSLRVQDMLHTHRNLSRS